MKKKKINDPFYISGANFSAGVLPLVKSAGKTPDKKIQMPKALLPKGRTHKINYTNPNATTEIKMKWKHPAKGKTGKYSFEIESDEILDFAMLTHISVAIRNMILSEPKPTLVFEEMK